MIDVKGTILATIIDKIKKMRYLGDNDPKTLKKILSLIVVDDLYEWSIYLNLPKAVLLKLKDLRTSYILCLKIFNIEYGESPRYYVNVNTPQTDWTWKRLWDVPNRFDPNWDNVDKLINPDLHPEPFEPDPNCPISITYYGGPMDEIPADELGRPYVDFATLTICEKMSIFINRLTGLMFVIDPATGNLIPVKTDTSNIDWDNIQNKPDIYSGVEHHVNDGNELVVQLTQGDNIPSSVPVTDCTPDLTNADLNDIIS